MAGNKLQYSVLYCMMCYDVLFCVFALLCYVMLPRTVLCCMYCVVLSCIVLCPTGLRCVGLYRMVLCCFLFVPCFAGLCCVVLSCSVVQSIGMDWPV